MLWKSLLSNLSKFKMAASASDDQRVRLGLRRDGAMDVDYFRPNAIDIAAHLIKLAAKAKPDFSRGIPGPPHHPHGFEMGKLDR